VPVNRPIAIVGVAAVMFALLDSAAHAVITAPTKFRQVESVVGEGDLLSGGPGARIAEADNHALQGLGTFNETAEIAFELPGSGRSSAFSSMISELTPRSLTAHGEVLAESDGPSSRAHSRFVISLDVASRTSFSFDVTMGHDEVADVFRNRDLADFRMERHFESDPDQIVFEQSITGDVLFTDGGAHQPFHFSFDDELDPGRYLLVFNDRALTFGEGRTHGTFDVRFNAGDGVTADPIVPLPPAVWSGLLVLGGCSLKRLRRTFQAV
jgi:hypothetical protein